MTKLKVGLVLGPKQPGPEQQALNEAREAKRSKPPVEKEQARGDPLPPVALARLGTVRRRHPAPLHAGRQGPSRRRTRRRRPRLDGHNGGGALILALSPDGKRLAVADRGRPRRQGVAAPGGAGADAARASVAASELAASAARAIPFLQGRLKPAVAVEPQRLRRLLDGLDTRPSGESVPPAGGAAPGAAGHPRSATGAANPDEGSPRGPADPGGEGVPAAPGPAAGLEALSGRQPGAR
jgi:hypothetical protein